MKMLVSTVIQATPERVWQIMLDDATYRVWTSAFYPGSYFKGEWKAGTIIYFLGPNPEGTGEGGMVTEVKEVRPFEFVSLMHLGIMKDGVEDRESPEAKAWAGSYENYTFTPKNGGTEVTVEMDILEDFKGVFTSMWVKGLERVKALAEASA